MNATAISELPLPLSESPLPFQGEAGGRCARRVRALCLFLVALLLPASGAFAQAGFLGGAATPIYQPIPNFSGVNAGAQFRNAINNRFGGVQGIAPLILPSSIMQSATAGQFLLAGTSGAISPITLNGDASASTSTLGAITVNHFTLTANASAGGFKLSNLAAATVAGDAISQGQSGAQLSGGSATGMQNANNSVLNPKANLNLLCTAVSTPYSFCTGTGTGTFAPAQGNGLQTWVQTATAGTAAVTLGELNRQFATGDGSATSFSQTIYQTPGITVVPKSVTVISTSPSQTCTDNGSGGFSGAGCTSGTINYTTGQFSVTFSVAPTSTASVQVTATEQGLTTAMAGRGIWIVGAGSGSNTLVTTIASVTDTSHMTMSVAPSTTVGNAVTVWGNDDTAAIQSAYNALQPGQTISFPQGYYLTSSVLEDNVSGTRTLGVSGRNSVFIQSSYSDRFNMSWLHGSVIFNVGNGSDGLHYLTDATNSISNDGGAVSQMVIGSLGRREGLTGLAITSASESGNVVTLTMASPVPSDIKLNTEISISGVSNSQYNWPAAGVISASGNTITYYNYYTGLGAATGGTVSILPLGLGIGSTTNGLGSGYYVSHITVNGNELQNWAVGLSFYGQYSQFLGNTIGSVAVGYLLNLNTNGSLFSRDGVWNSTVAGYLSYFGTADEIANSEVEQTQTDGMAIFDCEECSIHNNYFETNSGFSVSDDYLKIASLTATGTGPPTPHCLEVKADNNHFSGASPPTNAGIEVLNKCANVSIENNRDFDTGVNIELTNSSVANSVVVNNELTGTLVNNGSTTAPGVIQDATANTYTLLTPETFKSTVTLTNGTATTTLKPDGSATFGGAVSPGSIWMQSGTGLGIRFTGQQALWDSGSEMILDNVGNTVNDWKILIPLRWGTIYSAAGTAVPAATTTPHARLCVSDSTTCTSGTTYVSGGSTACELWSNGTNWIESGSGC